MIKVKYRRLHVPERCDSPHHPNKVYTEVEGEQEFVSYQEAVEEFARWNQQGHCWQYVILAVEPEQRSGGQESIEKVRLWYRQHLATQES